MRVAPAAVWREPNGHPRNALDLGGHGCVLGSEAAMGAEPLVEQGVQVGATFGGSIVGVQDLATAAGWVGLKGSDRQSQGLSHCGSKGTADGREAVGFEFVPSCMWHGTPKSPVFLVAAEARVADGI